MGRGDSSWQDRNHHLGTTGGKKSSTGTISRFFKKKEEVTETTPTVDTSVGTEGYDDTKGSKAVSTTTQSTTSKKRKSSLKVNISGAGGTGRNIV
jgi:ABC-type Fe2+-enterobactin transport system substrate-binding protein